MGDKNNHLAKWSELFAGLPFCDTGRAPAGASALRPLGQDCGFARASVPHKRDWAWAWAGGGRTHDPTTKMAKWGEKKK